jgi:CUB/sushi domain-containing protein
MHFAATACPEPRDLANGTVIVSGQTFQSRATYTCDPGFSLDGPKDRSCSSNGKWTGKEPLCKRMSGYDCKKGSCMYIRLSHAASQCRPPKSLPNGKYEGLSAPYFYQDQLTATCNDGFVASGPGRSNLITCGADGRWNDGPQCVCEKLYYKPTARVAFIINEFFCCRHQWVPEQSVRR